MFGLIRNIHNGIVVKSVLKRIVASPDQLTLRHISQVLYYITWIEIPNKEFLSALTTAIAEQMTFILSDVDTLMENRVKIKDVVNLVSSLFQLLTLGQVLQEPCQRIVKVLNRIPVENIVDCADQKRLARDITTGILQELFPDCCDQAMGQLDSFFLEEKSANLVIKPVNRFLATLEIERVTLEEPLNPGIAKTLMRMNLNSKLTETNSGSGTPVKMKPSMRNLINVKVSCWLLLRGLLIHLILHNILSL